MSNITELLARADKALESEPTIGNNLVRELAAALREAQKDRETAEVVVALYDGKLTALEGKHAQLRTQLAAAEAVCGVAEYVVLSMEWEHGDLSNALETWRKLREKEGK